MFIHGQVPLMVIVPWAAFEYVSKLNVRSENEVSLLDFRLAQLPRLTPPDDGYDPRDHREPKDPITKWMAAFNLIRAMLGAGVLGLPLAVSQAGIILGPIMCLSLSILIIHTHLTLLWCCNEISRQLRIPYISYRYGFRIALLHGPRCCQIIGRHGPSIIAVLMLLSQLGICTVFVIFTTDSLRDLMDWPTSKPAIGLLLVPYLLLEHFMKSLSIISYVSMFGNFLNLVGLIIIIYQIFIEPHRQHVFATTEPLALFFVIGTCLFNLSALAVILSLDKALQNPKVLSKPYGILSRGMFIPTLSATIFGVLGYWSFGTMEENVLRSLPFDDYSALTAIGLYLVATAFIYPIQCYPAIQMITDIIKNWNLLDAPSDKDMLIIENIARPVFVLTSFLVCFCIPIQGAFVAFVGNLCTTLLALVFPALMELSILYPNYSGNNKIILIKDLVIITFGLVCWMVGVIMCGYLMYVRILSLNSINNVEFYRK